MFICCEYLQHTVCVSRSNTFIDDGIEIILETYVSTAFTTSISLAKSKIPGLREYVTVEGYYVGACHGDRSSFTAVTLPTLPPSLPKFWTFIISLLKVKAQLHLLKFAFKQSEPYYRYRVQQTLFKFVRQRL